MATDPEEIEWVKSTGVTHPCQKCGDWCVTVHDVGGGEYLCTPCNVGSRHKADDSRDDAAPEYLHGNPVGLGHYYANQRQMELDKKRRQLDQEKDNFYNGLPIVFGIMTVAALLVLCVWAFVQLSAIH